MLPGLPCVTAHLSHGPPRLLFVGLMLLAGPAFVVMFSLGRASCMPQ